MDSETAHQAAEILGKIEAVDKALSRVNNRITGRTHKKVAVSVRDSSQIGVTELVVVSEDHELSEWLVNTMAAALQGRRDTFTSKLEAL